MLLSLLIPLRPDPPQAVVGHHLLKQILERDGNTEMRNIEKKKFNFESILDLDSFIEMSGRRAERKGKGNMLTASMSVNCSATIIGSNDRKLKAGSSSSKPLSSCVAKGQPMCSPEEIKTHLFHNTALN